MGNIADWKWDKAAWMIEGKVFGEQPSYKPVSVPPINEIIDRIVFTRGTIIQINKEDFERIRAETLKRQLNPKNIPLLEREPLSEQELLSVAVSDHKKFGIEKILKVQQAFPDMLVKINGQEVYLELEVRSLDFINHGHIKDLRTLPNNKYEAKLEKDKNDNKLVAVLCWVNDDKDHKLRKLVPDLKVHELQSLIRDRKKIEL